MSRKVKVCLALFLSFAVLAQYSFTPQAMVAYGMDNTVESAQAEDSGSDSGQSSEKQEATKPAPEPTKATEAPAPTPAPAATTESTQATEPTEATTVPEEQSDDVEDENDVNTGDPIAGEDPAAEEEEAAEEDEEEEWEHSFSGSCNGLTVKVSAPDGAFKKGTKMNLSAISDATAASIVSSVLPEDKEVADVVGVDISFSYKGSKDQPNESVKVSISGASLEGSNPVLYHKHGGAVEQSGASNNGASITTGAFSPFIMATSTDGAKAATWTVNFRDRDGDIESSKTVEDGAPIGDMPEPESRGDDYTAYWTIGTHSDEGQGSWSPGEKKVSSDTIVTSDLDLVPGYDKVKHTIKFYDSEDLSTLVATKTVDVDTSYCLNDIPTVPKEEGKVGKWVYEGGDFSNKVQATSDITVWAEYERNEFTVNFTVDGEVYESDTYYAGDALTLPADPVKEGADFEAWYNGTTKIVGGEEVTSDMTIEAKFSDMYFVRFVVLNDDGSVKETLSQYFRTKGEAINTLPQDPFVAGKSFEKWINQDTGDEVTADTVVQGNITATAQFHTMEVFAITAEYYYLNDNGTEVIFNTDVINVEGHELPYTITAPSSTQTSDSEVAGGPVYYPETPTQSVSEGDFEDGKATVRFKYVEHTAEYYFVYMLKNLNGDGYTEIGRDKIDGVLHSIVTPVAKSFDYAVLEKADEATEITQAEGQELKVYYTRKDYAVSYDSKGGSYIAGATVPYGTDYALTETVPTRAGYKFDGWYLDEELTQPAGDTVNVKGDTTVYAKWNGAQTNYTIVYLFEKYNDAGTSSSYVYDNSETGTAKTGYVVKATDGTIPDKTRKGWEKDNAKNAESSVEVAADGSSVLYVYYKLKEYTFTFNAGTYNYYYTNYNVNATLVGKGSSGTGTLSYTMKVKLGQDISKSWPAEVTGTVRIGNRTYNVDFNGWLPANSSTRYVTKRLIVTDDMLPASGNSRNFTAQWTGDANTYTVNYWLQNADNDEYTRSEEYSQTYTSSNGNLSAKEIAGYTYDHGNSGATATTYNFYYNRNTYKIDYYYGSKSLKSIADIKFDANINSNTYNWKPTATECGVDNDYVWGGWYSDAGLTTPYTFSRMPASNVVLYGKWTAPEFEVTFDTAGGSEIAGKTVSKYQTVERPADPTREGYTFDGWYTSADGKELYQWTNQITEDTTIYAHWSMDPLSYTVRYVTMDGEEEIEVAQPKTVSNLAFEVGETVTEDALAVAGYRPDKSTKSIVLRAGENVITFVYSPKTDKTSYTVRYLLDPEESEVEGDVELADPKKVDNVDGKTLSVIEMAIDVPDENHPEFAGQEFYPDEAEKSLTLSANEKDNVLTFYYSRYKTAKVTVNYVDMKGNQIENPSVQTLKIGKTFTLAHTPIPGWELNKAVEGTAYDGKVADSSYKITDDNEKVFTLYYQKKVTITANSFTKQYDGKALTMPTEIADQISVEGVDASKVTSIAFDYANADTQDGKGRLNAGVAKVTPKDASIDGNTTANGNYYKIRYISGNLEVTTVNVTIRIEPDRWTGNEYDGTVKEAGFTNGAKPNYSDYILISDKSYSDKHIKDIWDAIKALPNVEKQSGTASGLGYYVEAQKDAGDYSYNVELTESMLPEDENYSVSLYVRPGRLQILPAEATVTTGSASKAYDGTALTNDEASIKGLVSADEGKVTVTATGSRTDVGTSDNTYSIKWGTVNPNNYTITEKLGTLEVTKASLKVSVENATKEYNGEEQKGETKYNVSGLAEGHKLTVEYTPATGTDVGPDYTGSFAKDFTITDSKGNDVSDFYNDEVEFIPGKLEITPLAVTVEITGNKDSKQYNGKEQKVEGYEVTNISSNLYTKDDFTFNGEAIAKGTDADTYPMNLSEDQFENTNDNFTVTFSVIDGQLLITKADLVVEISGNTAIKEYNGEEQKVEGYEVTIPEGADFTEDDIEFSGEAIAKGTDVDTYKMGLSKDQFKVTSTNYDVDFNVTDGQLEITPLAVTVEISGNTATKEYNGEEQNVEGYEVTSISSKLYTKDDFTFSGEAIAKGTDVDTYKMGLKDNQFTNKNDNFTVTFSVTDGQLEITPLAVTVKITGNKDSKPYTGEEQKVEGYEVTSISSKLYTKDDFTFNGEAVAKGTNVDSYKMGLKDNQFKNENKNFTVTFSVTDGQLTITPIELKITAKPQTYTYNGNAQGPVGTYTKGIDTYVTAEGLKGKDALTSITLSGTGTNAGTYAGQIVPSAAEIGEATGNYKITYVKANLTINKASVTIAVSNGSKKYGENDPTFTGTVKGLVNASDLGTITYSRSNPDQNNAAVYSGVLDASFTANSNYEVTVAKGDFTIYKRSVTITSASAQKVYDGTALTNHKVTITGDGFVKGEEPSIIVTGSQTAVGSSKNTFRYSFANVSGSALDAIVQAAGVGDNYEIKSVFGTLTVTQPSTPTPTPTPDGGGNNPGGGVTPAAPFNPIPAAIDDTPAPTTIIDDDAPRAATGFWALINLICAILTALLSLIMLIRYFGKRREEDEETGEVTEIKRKGGVKLASIIPAIGAIIAFILTEDMSLPMQMIDKWTILMVVILAIQVLVAFFSRKKEEEEDQEDEGAMA